MRHRPEIDGLRALAVLPVILFHAGFGGFSGGFLGVDVFFFISGYLITGILLGEIEDARFSIIRFYERRARRILPALFVVLAASFPLAMIWLLPEQLRFFGTSVLATLAFVSNLLFAGQSGYFSPDTELIPLVHTWSLSVEEQFYIFFPVLLAGLMRHFRRGAVAILFLLAGMSLLYGFSAAVEDKAVFYSTWARTWELMAGSLAAFAHKRYPHLRSNLLGLVGLGAMIWAIFLHEPLSLPSDPYAILAITGLALVILFGTEGTLTAHLLSWRPLTAIGLISYSAYLWHQPILAFARVRMVVEPPAALMAGLVLLTLVLSYFTWKYVEEPVRRGRIFQPGGNPRLFVYALSGAAVIAGCALALRVDSGLTFRFTQTQQAWIHLNDFRNSMREYWLGTCFLDYGQTVDVLVANRCAGDTLRRRVIVLGDSEAAHLVAGARVALEGQAIDLAQWTATGCRPFAYAGNSRRCINMLNSFFKDVLPGLKADDIVLIGANWSTSLETLGTTAFSRAIKSSFMRISRQGVRAVVVGDVPNFDFDPLLYLVQNTGKEADDVSVEAQAGSVGSAANEQVRAAAATAKFQFLDPAPLFCPPPQRSICLILKHGQPLFFDGNHLSASGSVLLIGSLDLHAVR